MDDLMEFVDVSDLLASISSEEKIKDLAGKFGLTDVLGKAREFAESKLAGLDLNSALNTLSEMGSNPASLFGAVGLTLDPEVEVEVDDD